MDPFKENNTIYWAKLRPDAVIPSKEFEDAGYDIYATFEEDYIIIEPFKTKLIPTGLSWACSPDFYMQIVERSSSGTLGLKISAGVLDSGYRGEIKVALYNATGKTLVLSLYGEDEVKKMTGLDDFIYYSTSKAIAQGIIHRVEHMNAKEISRDALLEIPSKRGEKGWGSTNKEITETLKAISDAIVYFEKIESTGKNQKNKKIEND